MRIGMLTQWFDPEPGPAAIPGVLARGLAQRGHDVQILTGYPNYPLGVVDGAYRVHRRMDERMDGLLVRRVALYPSHNSSKWGRAANYMSFGASAVLSGVDAFKDVDAIWVDTSPITVAWPMWAAKIRMNVPSVVHIMDLWPDTMLLSGFASHGPVYAASSRLLDSWCRAIYHSASSISYISPGIREVLLQRGVPVEKLSYVPLWADEAVFYPSDDDLRTELGLSPDAVVLLYAGSLGDAQGLSTLIDACASIDDPRFVCLIAGSGVAEGALRNRAIQLGADCIKFIGRVSQSEMTRLMATADFNYIGLRKDPLSAVTMPSKTHAILASGRAMVVAAEGDVADVPRESGAGWSVDPGDVNGLRAALIAACDVGRQGLHRMGACARSYYERNFAAELGVQRVEVLLQRAAATR